VPREEPRDGRRFPPPGSLVDVGGRRLHLVCIRRGEPTVIFEASGFSNSLSSEVARSEVAKHVRVCSYPPLRIDSEGSRPTMSRSRPVALLSLGMCLACAKLDDSEKSPIDLLSIASFSAIRAFTSFGKGGR